MSNFLDADSNLFEKNLKIVKNEFEDELAGMFASAGGGSSSGGAAIATGISEAPPREYKVVTPTAGLCIKSFKVNTNDKYFINLVQTDGIPPPEDITEEELTAILQSDMPSSYRIPMSISEPRLTKDKSDNKVDVCDVAINTHFFAKCDKSILFRDFLVAIILEALSEKYNIQIKQDNWIILKNRKFIGKLVTHRVQNRDVKKVYESFKNLTDEERSAMESLASSQNSKSLIQEVNSNEIELMKAKAKQQRAGVLAEINQKISQAASEVPEHRLFAKYNGDRVEEVLAEFFLPKCMTLREINLDIGEDRILVESMKRGYLFDSFVDYTLDQEKASAKFNLKEKMLQVRLPVVQVN